MNLYQIPYAVQTLIDTETGEILNEDLLTALMDEREEKLEGLALVWKNADAMEKALQNEKKALENRIKSEKAKKSRIADALRFVLGTQSFETPRCKVSFRKTPEAVVIEEGAESSLIRWLSDRGKGLRIKEPEIDKAEVKQMIQGGEHVPGVKLESGYSVRIV